MSKNMLYDLKMNTLKDFISMGILFSEDEDQNDTTEEEMIETSIDKIDAFIKNNHIESIVNSKINDYRNKKFLIKAKYLLKNKISNLSVKNKTIEDLSNCMIMFCIDNNIDSDQNNLVYLFLQDFKNTIRDIMETAKNNL